MITDDLEAFDAAELLERGAADNTRASYGSDLRFFAAYLAKLGVTASSQITREHIVGFLMAERSEGLRSSTRARRTAAIRMFLRFLQERHLIAHNPSDLLDTPKKDKTLPRILTEAQVFAMLDAVSGTEPRERRDRAILETLYGCGLRVSELCALRMEDIVADGELLRVIGKGDKERLVPITGAAGRAMNDYFASARLAFTKGDLAETHVFVTRLGRPFTRQGIFKIIKERAAAVGIPASDISPHVLRHCYASHMLQHGADIRSIQELLGHADIGTTQIYTHVDTARFSDIHRKYHPRA